MATAGAQVKTRLGRYELLARLATGGMGEIFLARLEGAEGFEKLYVVKRILPHLADDARFRQMLIAEARIASRIAHPNICQVYELGETDGQLYIVMEYLEGITMLPLLRRASKEQHPLELGFIGGVLQQVCDALHYAHELKDRTGESLGIVHRDVTPSNVFLTESGVAKVLDFGIAKAKGASTQTQEGTVKGKYAYMAPEQLRGGGVDRRVDVFALGVLLYEMLALRRLFQRKTDYLTFRAVMEQPIPDVRRYRPDIPPALADVLARALDREPATRYESARQFGTAVLDALGSIARPWTQGELGDFLHASFADEIAKRSHQVANAVQRTGVGARATMPLFAQPDDAAYGEGDDDDEFPSVETDVAAGPPTVLERLPHAQSQPAPAPTTDFSGGTPPPFAAETTGSSPSLVPLRAPEPQPGVQTAPIIVVPRRSLVWPLLAVGMLAVAGGALFLVWQQMQHQQEPRTPIVIEQSSVGSSSAAAPVAVTTAPSPTGSAAAAGSDQAGQAVAATPIKPSPAHHDHAKPQDPYNAAIEAKKAAMQECVRAHSSEIQPVHATATVVVGGDGRATSITLAPEALDSSALGACIHGVLKTAHFPRHAAQFTFDLATKSSS